VVVIGYSFRDAHLMQLLDEALVKNRSLFLVIIDPDAPGLRAKVMTIRNVPERCLAIPKPAGDALRAGQVLNATNTVIQAQQQIVNAEEQNPATS